MNRVLVGTVLFANDPTRLGFLDLFADLDARFGVVVHAYALMPNHDHLLVTYRRGDLSRAMRHVGAELTRTVNATHGTDGALFRGRFKNRVIESDDDWRYVLRYVHADPVRAGRRVPTRWCASWWLSRRCGIGQGRICAALCVGHDALSRDIRRFEQRRSADARFAGWVAGLEKVSSFKT